MPLPHDKSQTWLKAEIEELAAVRSYKVKTEHERILRRNRRHLRRSRQPFYSSRPARLLQLCNPQDMAASPEKPKGPQPTEGQSFPTVAAQGDWSKQPTNAPVAIPSKAQPPCTTLNKSKLVENRTTIAGRSSKPPTLQLLKGLYLTTPDDCRRQLKKLGFFSFFFLLRH